jgi:4-hydroxy-tetrahydrodipicolinate reductase
MNIGLFGYGKMGRMIEQMALKRGHKITSIVDRPEEVMDFEAIDIAIDFSSPDAAFKNISDCINAGIPVVSGTTGWLNQYPEACALCSSKNGAFIYASNFSLGVNLFFALNAHLAKLMAGVSGYTAELEEIHHTQKLDAPSGTAITLAEGIVANSDYSDWILDKRETGKLPVFSKRIGDTPGTHSVLYRSEVDDIEITHTAHNREGFATGAVLAAEWLLHKKGVFDMTDVLNLR